MAFTKKRKVGEILIFSFLVAFPFGRLLAFEFPFLGYRFSFVILDFIAFLGLVYLIFAGRIKSYFSNSDFVTFIFPFVFSFIFSIFLFRSWEVLIGLFYFLRLFFYVGFCFFLINFLKTSKDYGGKLFDSLLLVLFFSLLFGFTQYIFYPDLTALKFLGWDDHLFRMTGTFLDPSFAGIIFVFGFILSWVKYKENHLKRFLVLSLLFLIGVVLTFSRASYISLLVAIFYLIFTSKEKWIRAFIILIFFILALFFVPKPEGEGVNLTRIYSITDRVENYKETLAIFLHSPVFGVGFNNLCLSRKVYLSDENIFSHSCSGSNSSILFILSTLGVMGLVIVAHLGLELMKKIPRSRIGLAAKVSIFSLLVHSQFDSSLFYPWVLAFLVIVFALVSAKIEQ